MKNVRYIFIIVCACVLFIAGCGKTDSRATTGRETTENNSPKENAVSWQASYARLEDPYAYALTTEDHVYGCYIKDGQVLLYRINKADLSVKEAYVLPGTDLITGLAADQEGNVYILGSKGESTGFWRINIEESLTDYIETELEDADDADDLMLKGLYTDPEGHFFVWCKMMIPETEMAGNQEMEVWHWVDRVYVKDKHLKTIFYEELADVSGTEVLHFLIGAESVPLFLVKDTEGVYMQEIDVSQGKRKDAVRLEKSGDFFDTDTLSSLENMFSADNGFLYCLDNELYEYHYDTQSTEKILNLTSYGIFSSDIVFLAKDQDGIEIIDNHGDSGYSEYISFTLGETEKKIITLGSTVMIPDLEKAVAEFNRCSSKYRVEIIDYVAQKGNYEDATGQLKLDVVTGKAPDIITAEGIDYSLFYEKGVLADLYDFMQEDAQMSKDMLVQSVVEAYEAEGHLYSIAPAFGLHSMWGYGDVTGGQSGVTFEELFRILEDGGKDLNAIAGFSGDEPVLTRLCTVSMDEFVDWENGTCDFEGDYFQKVLSFAKEYTGNYTGGTFSERIGKREVVLSVGMISSVADYQIQKELYGGDVAFIGYPVAEGSGTAVAYRGSAVAIHAKGENQAGAWEFVKFYLLHGYDGQGFPIIQRQFDELMDAAMEEDYAMAEDGGDERIPKGYYNDGGAFILVYAATQEDIDAVRGLVESAAGRFEPHVTIQNIIDEEAGAYFSGQVDLERTAEKIQNRVTLFLQESL